MDKETRELFADTIEAMRALNSQLDVQTRLLLAVARRTEGLERRADAQSTIIRALSGDERVLHEHDV